MPVCNICIGERIKIYRAENQLSQRAFGRLLGVTAQAVCKWESKICYPDITFLPELAQLFGCRIDDFFAEK